MKYWIRYEVLNDQDVLGGICLKGKTDYGSILNDECYMKYWMINVVRNSEWWKPYGVLNIEGHVKCWMIFDVLNDWMT